MVRLIDADALKFAFRLLLTPEDTAPLATIEQVIDSIGERRALMVSHCVCRDHMILRVLANVMADYLDTMTGQLDR